MDKEIIEEMELIRRIRPHLRFSPGDVVCLVSDMENKTPMVIKKLLEISMPEDYVVNVTNNRNQIEGYFLHDVMLKPFQAM